MKFTGFTERDFEVFSIDGLDRRMDALKTNIRPKLEALGHHFAPTLSTLTGDEMSYHVARHARRTKNPPNDTWVAFANSKRGYKMLPHFQIGLWESHLFIWFAVIYEAPIKVEVGKSLKNQIDFVQKNIPDSFVWSGDHTKPEATAHNKLNNEELLALFNRVIDVKKAEILCGLHLNRNQVIEMEAEQLIEVIDLTFKRLIPLYRLSQNN
jgi:uncharacterized protein YktB (UPF0637 family)